MKKLSALLFSLLLILSLAVPASAVGVSINDVTLTDMVGQTGWTFSIMEEGAAAPVEKTVTVYFFPAEGGKISVPNGKEPVIPFARYDDYRTFCQHGYDFVTMAQSPRYAPKRADRIIELLKPYIVPVI